MANNEQVRALLGATRDTRESEIDCDELLVRLPAFVERSTLEVEATTDVEGHLRLCQNCREEWHALVTALGEP